MIFFLDYSIRVLRFTAIIDIFQQKSEANWTKGREFQQEQGYLVLTSKSTRVNLFKFILNSFDITFIVGFI